MASFSFEGSCHCGAIKFRSALPATRPCFCHCQSCRTSSGAPFMAWVETNTQALEFTRGALKKYQSSHGVTRGFCESCGMSLSYHSTENATVTDIALTAIKKSEHLVPERHIWISDKVPWLTIGDGLPQFQGWSDTESPNT